MSEPKYKVGDWITHKHSDMAIKIKAMNYHLECYINDAGTWIRFEDAIPVKIIPITDKPYCKDCKCTEIIDEVLYLKYDEGEMDEVDPDNDTDECRCVLWNWVQRHTKELWICIDYKTQPPDNCYCFVPKESK